MSSVDPVETTTVPNMESPAFDLPETGSLRGTPVTTVETMVDDLNKIKEQSLEHAKHGTPVTGENTNLSLRVMMAVLDWLYTQQEAQAAMEKEQEAKKEQHWKLVQKKCAKQKESTTAPFVWSCLSSIATAAGAGLGYKSQSLLPNDPMSTLYSGAGGALQALGGLSDKYYEGVKSQRDADSYFIEQEAQKAEKSSQGQSSKVQKSERIEDSAQSFWKQMAQSSSQLSDAVSSMLRGH